MTGTPMCTAVSDLATQMEFLGLNHLDSYTALRQRLGASSSGSKRHWSFRGVRDDQLLYLLSNFMMRHTLTQGDLSTHTQRLNRMRASSPFHTQSARLLILSPVFFF